MASSDPGYFNITTSILNKLLIALNECSEWGRVAILNALARYIAQDEKESEHICERVVPQFQHVNGSVVLAAVKVGYSFISGTSSHLITGHHDPYARCSKRRTHKAACAKNGPATGYATILTPGGPVGRSQKYQSSPSEAAWYPLEWNARIFLQIQRSSLRESRKIGYNGQASQWE